MDDRLESTGRIAFDLPDFTFGAFLRDRWVTLLLAVLCALGIYGMLGVLGLGHSARIAAAAFILICAAIGLIVDFVRRRSFYGQLAEAARSIDRASHMGTMLTLPAFLEGKMAYEALDGLSRMSGLETARIVADAQDYRDYIELWVHEAKTPLAAASLILAQMHGEESDRLAREMERVERQIEQALYYARSTSLGNEYDLAQVPLRDVLNEACKKSRRFLIENNVRISNTVDEAVIVIADKTWLVFVIDQLLTNAAKYGATEITLLSVQEEMGTPREHTLLTIADNGWGIPASDLPRVFERAFTGSNGRAKGYATGMGLYIVATLVERMGLSVAIASEEGVGTRVMLAFPHDLTRASLAR